MKKIFTFLFVLCSVIGFAQSTTVVISQVYGGGGATSGTPTYKFDYVELHNVSTVTQNIGGFSLQYGSATGNFGNAATAIFVFPAGTSIPAGGYYLVKLGTDGTAGANLPVTPDQSSTNLSMSGTNGKVALVNNSTALGCGATACPLPSASIIDLVSYGNANNAEGAAAVPVLSTTTGAVRKNNGCLDTDNNANDFDVVTNPVPRNSSSAIAPCSTLPASIMVTGTINDFGNIVVGTSSTSQSYNISGANLTNAPGVINITAPTDFEVSNNNSTWAATTTIAYTSATLAATPVWVRFTPTTAGPKTGNVTNAGGGVTTAINVAVSGNAIAPATPTLSATALGAFGANCINSTAGPNSFTINGLNLTATNITVGPLAGFSFATTATGTYTPSLTLTQAGGNYSQQVFVNFTPTAVQSYDGSIAISGAGATTINVAASGSGNNNAPAVTTGTASNITTTSATLAGTITSIGCSAATAYGIEYSTTSGFANGTGTAVAGTNLSGGNYSVNLLTLTPNTQYYYKAYATNTGGTAYGAQQTFRTATPVIVATPLTAFGALCVNATGGPNSFTLTSTGLSSANVLVGPLSGYSFSTTANGTYTSTLSITQPGGTFNQAVFVKFTPTAVQSYNGNIPVSGGAANTINVAVSGSGVNSPATLTTGAATNVMVQTATTAGTLINAGCSMVTQYGIEYSGINNFPAGAGTKVFGSNMNAAGEFTVNLSGLVPATDYYYRAFAISSAGSGYGAQQSFTTDSIANGFIIYGNPINKGGLLRISLKNLTPDHYGIKLYNMMGQLVYRKDINAQLNFIDITFIVPANIPSGMYLLELESNNGRKENQPLMIR
jgi:hypothetical protein